MDVTFDTAKPYQCGRVRVQKFENVKANLKAWRRRAAAAIKKSPSHHCRCRVSCSRKTTTAMLETPSPSPSVFTATSAYSLAGVAGIAVIAKTAAGALLPRNAPWQDRVTFIWLVRTPPCLHTQTIFWASLTTRNSFPLRLRYPKKSIWIQCNDPPQL